jgi:hypothetical protein
MAEKKKPSFKDRMRTFVEALPDEPLEEPNWVAPDPKVYRETYQLLYDLCRYLFGVDCDNDSCVIVSLIDRTREEKDNFRAIPHLIEESRRHPYGESWNPADHTPEENEVRNNVLLENRSQISRIIGLNHSLSSQRIERFLQDYEYDISKQKNKPANDRAKRIKFLERVKKVWDDQLKLAADKSANLSAMMTELETLKAFTLPKPIDWNGDADDEDDE